VQLQETSQQQQELGQQQGAGHGRVTEKSDSSVPVWLLVGLGARGLVYHAWLGQLTAAAVISDSEDQLPPELLSWQQQRPPRKQQPQQQRRRRGSQTP
jgi:hypothetical protein